MMASTEIGPIRVEADASEVRFRFVNPHIMTLEIPVSLEEELSTYLQLNQASVTGKRLVIDLVDLAAVSSRQLGMMLTIRKICQPFGPVELEAVSDGVRYLLNLTRMAKYFNLPEPGDR